MEIILFTSKAYQNSVIDEINKKRNKYSNIKNIVKNISSKKNIAKNITSKKNIAKNITSKKNIAKNIASKQEYCVIITHKKLTVNQNERQKLIKSYKKLKHVTNVSIFHTSHTNFKKDYRNKDCRFIFDIDSTLTPGQPGILSKNSKPLLTKLSKHDNTWIHFATGRTDGDVRDLIKHCNTEPQGIAENGGLIVLDNSEPFRFGNRDNPDKAFICLQKKYKNRVKQDTKQHSRITERIIQKNLSKEEYEKCTKKHNVSVLASKTSYHIVDKNVNKGTALRKLIDMRNWNDDFIITVGDSDLDIPMFEEADVSFAVSNSSPLAKQNASHVLNNSYDKGVKEMFDTWFSNYK